MNRNMDYRTDFYSLGATLYQLLTGQLPFQADDALELVCCHLSKMPPPPYEIMNNSPLAIDHSHLSILSAIILKLMAKNAEDRYQSAFGLKADLEWCLEHLHAPGTSETPGTFVKFELGQHDIPERFHIPQKLYGRAQEVSHLLAVFDRIAQTPDTKHLISKSEMLLVAGYSGIGKSALVHEIHKPITSKRGYFIEGKFDQFQRNEPYSALIKAFQSLVCQLLTEAEARMTWWKERLLNALGPNGQVMIEVIPEVTLLIGSQPAVPELPPSQAQNRFHFTFQNFMRTFTAPEHPLVIFLDDLQWADSPSLQLLKRLMTGSQIPYVLIIGAYRDNEVNAAHPLMLTLKDMQQAGAAINTITLGPLALHDVTQLIADTLQTQTEVCTPLAEICHQKTGGNPFFLMQFLEMLYAEGLLTFNPQTLTWQWDIEAIRQATITENVVDLLAHKIQKLPKAAQQVLQLAACIGNQFDLQTLALIHEHSQPETLQDLWAALQEGLVVPLDESYKYVAGNAEFPSSACALHADRWEGQEWVNSSFKFLHDRVQQAAYALIADERKQTVHLTIGRLLLANLPVTEQGARVFEIVDYVNAGHALATNPDEKERFARLNLYAGQKAKASAAYASAYQYLQNGLALLGQEPWQQQYDLTLALHVEAAEAAYLCGNFDAMEWLAGAIITHARTVLDKVKAYEVKIRAYLAEGKLHEALQTGRWVIKLLGIHFPQRAGVLDFLSVRLKEKLAFIKKPVEDLVNLPDMTDLEILLTIRILMHIDYACYVAAPDLLPLVSFEGLRLSIKYGNAPVSTTMYAIYGVVLCGIGNIETGYQLGELSLVLMDKLDAREFKTKVFTVVHNFIMHWKKHLKEIKAPLQEAYKIGLETGDLEYAGMSAFLYCYTLYFTGTELKVVKQEITSLGKMVWQSKQKMEFYWMQIYDQVVFNLSEEIENPCCLKGEGYDEEIMLPRHVEADDKTALCHLYANKLILCYLFQNYSQAYKSAIAAENVLTGLQATYAVPIFYFYDSLTRLALFPDVPKAEQCRFLKKVAANQKKMQKWAQHAPMNYLHKWQLVEAERARVLGKDAEAMELYDKAIAGAKTNEYINEEALANELAARFWLIKKKEDFAALYLKRAHQLYGVWGAQRKVLDLEERYPHILAQPKANSRLRNGRQHTITDTAATDSGQLDMTTVIKASQAISGELDLDKLLNTLLHIMGENAGANIGKLLLPEAGAWVVKAEVRPDGFFPPVRSDFPSALINYVTRLKVPVVLADARQDAHFSHDPYMQACQPLSVLCLPLIKQQQLVGLLYLENTLTANVFTPQRLELLNLLASQAAIAIENARLYDTLEQKVAERTVELEHANQAKTAFLSKMSHDLRTPLNAILGYTQNLRREQSLTVEQAKDLAAIQRSGEQLLWLINDLLDLSRIELGKIELHPRPFPFIRFLHNLVENFQSRAQERALILTAEFAPDLPACVYADEGRLAEILQNLLSNALKFTEHGCVTLEVTKVTKVTNVTNVTKVEDDAHQSSICNLRFSIQDTGVGIPAEHLSKIFSEFYQVPGEGVETQGTGLGLAICQQLVRLMGGELQVRSVVGQGSTFWFDLALPVIDEHSLPIETRSMPRIVGYTGARRRILVVDDREDNRAILCTPLTALGFEALEATNGREALNLLVMAHEAQHAPPDAILMDLRMPEMDGIEAARRIRELNAGDWILDTGYWRPASSIQHPASSYHWHLRQRIGRCPRAVSCGRMP